MLFHTTRRRHRRFAVAAATALAALGTSAATATHSGASPPTGRYFEIASGSQHCEPGYFCVWEALDFSGRGIAFEGNAHHYSHLVPERLRFIDDQGRSAFNNGTPGDKSAVRFFEDVDWDLGGNWGCISAGVKVGDLGAKGSDANISSHLWLDRC